MGTGPGWGLHNLATSDLPLRRFGTSLYRGTLGAVEGGSADNTWYILS